MKAENCSVSLVNIRTVSSEYLILQVEACKGLGNFITIKRIRLGLVGQRRVGDFFVAASILRHVCAKIFNRKFA